MSKNDVLKAIREAESEKTRNSGQKDLDKIRSEGEANRKTAVDAIINSFVE